MDRKTESPERIGKALGAARPEHRDIAADVARANVRNALIGRAEEVPRIGRFTILDHIGSGGMGSVFSAYDPQLDRKVAIKTVTAGTVEDRQRVILEARAQAKLTHPNVVAVYDSEALEEEAYIAMEFVRGSTLRQVIEKERASWRDDIKLVIEAGQGLAAAHAVGLVHGDFKPENILVGQDGRPRVADFGLAYPVDHDGGATESPLLQDSPSYPKQAGTPAYMAPEQLEGARASQLSDQYSFCMTLYEVLYGVRPSRRRNADLWSGRHETPRWLRRTLQIGLARDPAERFASMDELLARLRRGIERRRRFRMTAVGAGLLVATATGSYLLAARDAGPECAGGAALFETAWSAARAAQVQQGFVNSGRSHAAATFAKIKNHLAVYQVQWQASYKDACEATHVRGDQSAELLDKRMFCLRKRSSAVQALVDIWSTAPPPKVVDRAILALGKLPEVADCNQRERLAQMHPVPSDPAARKKIDDLRGRLAEVSAQHLAGQMEAATQGAKAAVADARALGWDPLQIDALRQQAKVQRERDPSIAQQAWLQILDIAAESEDDTALAEAGAALMLHAAKAKSAFEEAKSMIVLVRGLAVRSHDPTILANYWSTYGALHLELQKPDEAVKGYQAAVDAYETAKTARLMRSPAIDLALAEAYRGLSGGYTVGGRYEKAQVAFDTAWKHYQTLYPSDHPDLAPIIRHRGTIAMGRGAFEAAAVEFQKGIDLTLANYGDAHESLVYGWLNLGLTHLMLSDHQNAHPAFQRGYQLARQLHGPGHAQTLTALLQLSKTERLVGDREAAKQQLEEVIKGRIALFSQMNTTVAEAVNSLGNLAREDGDVDTAITHYKRALHIWETALGPEHPAVSIALTNLGELYIQKRRWREATEVCRRALAIDVARRGEGHPDLAYPLACLGETALGQGQKEEAIIHLERAIMVRKQAPGDAVTTARISFALARALPASRRDEARKLAQQARDGLEKNDDSGAQTAEQIEQWLRQVTDGDDLVRGDETP